MEHIVQSSGEKIFVPLGTGWGDRGKVVVGRGGRRGRAESRKNRVEWVALQDLDLPS